MALTIRRKKNFLNITFDGSTDFDLCAYLGTTDVTLWAIDANAVAVNDTLTVRDGGPAEIRIYGPFIDTTGSGLMRMYRGYLCSPYIKGTETTSGGKATIEFSTRDSM